MGHGLGEKSGLEKLVDFQGSPPPSSRAIHPDEHGAHDRTLT